MIFAYALIFLVVGTVLFHFLSPWWFTPIASNWTMMDQTVGITFWVTGVVFVAINLFMAYCIIRYRHRRGVQAEHRPLLAHYQPENNKLEWWLTIITSVGIAAMLAPGLAVWAKFVTVPSDASEVEVVGEQWNFSYRFPGKDGVLGTTDVRLASVDNPFAIDPNDPKGQDDIVVSSSELHLPLGRPVKVLLRAKDVLHQFAVPAFRVKMDMVPGMVTYFWFTPTRTGSYDALCEQLCGMAHFTMRGRVVVDEPDAFQAWLAKQPTYAQTRAETAGDPAAGQASYALCSACHGPSGEGNPQLNAPKLSGQASWYLVRQLQDFKHGVRGAATQDTYGKQMVPFAATLGDDAAIRNVVAYIASLPDTHPAGTLSGNPERGRALYATCAYCHGGSGQGVWSTNAPRLSHMSDWYMKRQLQYFQQGLRGSHPQDFNGAQMAAMAKVLDGDQAINDVLDHIDTL
ncbi:MAG: c-type cytochrome [Pseudomonadota bacterium]|nr:c-type cytochrome [Pseudomonadota bacterium]